jgi:hypothetical protein
VRSTKPEAGSAPAPDATAKIHEATEIEVSRRPHGS